MTAPKYPLDPDLNRQYKDWVKFVCQCRFRKEHCDLTWEQYQSIWDKQYHRRGRKGSDLVMTRKNTQGAWTVKNVIIITRREQIQRKNAEVTAWRRSQGLKYAKHTRE